MNIKSLLAIMNVIALLLCFASCGSEDDMSSTPSTVTLNVATGDNAEPVEIDVSDMDNPFVYKNLIIDLPKDFVSDEKINNEAGIVMAFKGSARTSTDCYTFSDTGFKQSLSDYSKEEMEKNFQKDFEGFIAFEDFSEGKCCGYDSLKTCFTRNINDAKIIQKQLYIFANNTTYMITYTTEVKKNVKDYESSIESIIVK